MHAATTAFPGATASLPRRPDGVHPLWFGLGLVLMGLLLALALTAAQPPAPKPVTAPADEFSAARALVLAERLLGDGAPHPIGTMANARVGDGIIAELTELGYTVETQETLGCRAAWATCGHVTNILTRLPGKAPGPAVLLSAHYDSVAASPGAADDIAGVAAILEIARILSLDGPLSNPVILLFSDGEEPGLLGAEAFMAEHPWAAEVGVVVNLEASGTSGPSVLFETTDDNAWLIEAYQSHASRPVASSLFDALIALSSQNTDLAVYEANGVPVVNFAFVENAAHYHTPLDNLANLNPASVQHHGDNALAAVRAFAGMDLASPPPGASLVVDALPGLLLRWPAGWAVWLALAGLAGLAATAGTLIRRGELSGRAAAWGLPVLPLGLLLATVAGGVWATGLSAITGAPVPWYASPGPMRLAVWTGALLLVVVSAALFSRRAGFWGLSLGVWTCWTLLAALTGWLAPGFSVMLLPPALLGVLALAVVGLSPLRFRPWARAVAGLVGLAGTSWFWLPFALGIEQTEGGPELGAIIAFAAALAASPLIPFVVWPVPRRSLRRWALAGGGVLVAIATVAVIVGPVYSAQRPQRLNLLQVEQRHLGEARWLIEVDQPGVAGTAAVPTELLAAAPFAPEPASVLAWSGRSYLSAPTAETGDAAPAIEVLADDLVAGERVVTLRLRSPRGGHRLSLYVPEGAGVNRIVVRDTTYVAEAPRAEHGYHAFHCHAPACDGITVAVHLARPDAVDLLVADWTPGLPDAGEVLRVARPITAVPSHQGDGTLIVDRLSLAAA